MENQQTEPARPAGGGEVIDKLKTEAGGVAANLKNQGAEHFESGKRTAADQTEKLAEVVGRAAQELRGQDQQSLADYAGQLAGGMKNFAESLRERSLDDLVRDTHKLARNNPTLFVTGSVVIGIALSRLLKASAERTDRGLRDDQGVRTALESDARPVTFEPRPAVTSMSSPKAPTTGDTPSFADDLEKGA
jgi:hypothetical protein